MKKMYVVVSHLNGLAGRTKSKLTNYPYNHVSVSFREDLSVMYSFARRRRDVPLVGGFVEEYPSRMLSTGGDIPIRVYTVPVDDEDYYLIRDVLRRMMSHPQIYSYNIYEEAARYVGGTCRIKCAYTDISFVCKLLRIGNVKNLKELEFILSPFITYEGTYNEVAGEKEQTQGAEYFEEVPSAKAAYTTLSGAAKLLGRKVYDLL